MIHAFTHSWRDHEVKYSINESTTTISIGAMSYTSLVQIYDYSPYRPYGSPPGYIQIKKFCSIGDQVRIHIFDHHDYKRITTNPLMPLVGEYRNVDNSESKSESVIIGNDVWIGNNATILSDIEIGDGAVIGANAVVSKNIPPYAIAVGNPIRVIKYHFSHDIVKEMLKIRWWDWENEKILENAKLLHSQDINQFVETHAI